MGRPRNTREGRGVRSTPRGRSARLGKSALLLVAVVVGVGSSAVAMRAVAEGDRRSASPRTLSSIEPEGPPCEAGEDPAVEERRAALLDRRAPGPRRQGDPSCYASLRERRRLLADARTLVVDVRRESEFERFRIPGSIHLRLGALRTKAHWRERPLLLVNEGWGHAELEEGCRQLRKAGFTRVSILAGGLRTWREEVGPLEGERAAQASLSRIPPRGFARERAYDRWLVVDVSAPGESAVEAWLPEAVRVPFSPERDGPGRFVRTLGDALRERQRARPETTLLLVDAEPERYGLLERELADRALPRTFYLEGGLPAYRAYHRRRAAVLAQRERPSLRSGCATR